MRTVIPKLTALHKPLLFKLLLFVFFSTFSATLFAAYIVKGRIMSESGTGLAGATIAEKNRANTTTTAADGSFSINVAGQEGILLISYVGYQAKEVSVPRATSDLVVNLAA